MHTIKRLTGGAVAAAGLALMTGSAVAQTFTTTTVTTYATQAVVAAGGAITVPTAGITWTSPTLTAVSTAGSFLITFTLPTGVTFSINPTANITTTSATCATAPNQLPSGGGNGANNAVFTVTVLAGGGAGTGNCSVSLNAFTVLGATQLQTATTSTSGLAGGFAMTEQVSGSTGTVPTFNQTASLPTGIASSVNALALTTAPGRRVPATINVLPPSNGTKITQGAPISTTNVAFADLGTLQTSLLVAQNATATGQFFFTGSTTTDVITGNWTGANNAYMAPVGTNVCATTFAGRPSGSITGSISGNTITFVGGAAGFNTGAQVGVVQAQEICVYYTGSTIIGQNPPAGAAGGISLSATVDSTTSNLNTTTNPLNNMTYNGVVQNLAYTGCFNSGDCATAGAYTAYIRTANYTSGSVQVFAVVQSETGSIGTATITSALGPNSNLLTPAATVVSNAGVTLDSTGRASLTLLAPFGVVFKQLLINPNGVITELGGGAVP